MASKQILSQPRRRRSSSRTSNRQRKLKSQKHQERPKTSESLPLQSARQALLTEPRLQPFPTALGRIKLSTTKNSANVSSIVSSLLSCSTKLRVPRPSQSSHPKRRTTRACRPSSRHPVLETSNKDCSPSAPTSTQNSNFPTRRTAFWTLESSPSMTRQSTSSTN